MIFSSIEEVKFDYEKIVIVSSIEALLYCYYNNVPFVCAKMESPDRFSYFDCELDLSIFQLANPTTSLTTFPPANETRGMSKLVLWEHLYFCLSLAGLNPLADKVSSIRIEDNKVRAFTHKARSATINCGPKGCLGYSIAFLISVGAGRSVAPISCKLWQTCSESGGATKLLLWRCCITCSGRY